MARQLHRRLFSLHAFLVAAILSLNAIAATDFKIITLQHRFVEDILPIIQPLAGSEGVITGMQNQLIIRASPEKMIEIEQVIATFDVARQNLKITVSHQSNLQTTNDGVTVNGHTKIGNTVISTHKYPKNYTSDIQVDIKNNQTKTTSGSNQFINVIEGERAFIQVGQSVPFTQEWITLTRRYLSHQQTIAFVDVSTGFSVRPRYIGSQIELEITPRISQLNQNGVIDFEDLSTVVLVNKDEWLDLGSIMQQRDDVSRAILSTLAGSQTQGSKLSIRVE